MSTISVTCPHCGRTMNLYLATPLHSPSGWHVRQPLAHVDVARDPAGSGMGPRVAAVRDSPHVEATVGGEVDEFGAGDDLDHRFRPPSYRGYCPRCAEARAAREFAELPWWRRTWARITGRRG